MGQSHSSFEIRTTLTRHKPDAHLRDHRAYSENRQLAFLISRPIPGSSSPGNGSLTQSPSSLSRSQKQVSFVCFCLVFGNEFACNAGGHHAGFENVKEVAHAGFGSGEEYKIGREKLILNKHFRKLRQRIHEVWIAQIE